MNFIIPIILGSEKDITLAEKIQTVLNKFEVNSIIRICSAGFSCFLRLSFLFCWFENKNFLRNSSCKNSALLHSTNKSIN